MAGVKMFLPIASQITLLLAISTLGGCALPATKRWHLATRDTEDRVEYTPHLGIFLVPLQPPRGPEIAYTSVRTIKIGDRGERIHEITQPQYPHYFKNGALVTTRIAGDTYEVAFRYRPDDSGIIADISYWRIKAKDE